MTLRKRIRLYGSFYQYFFPVSIVFALAAGYIVHLWGAAAISALLWIKALTIVIVIFFVRDYKRKELYYYRNLGFSIRHLWTVTLIADVLLLTFLLYITSCFR